MCSCKQFVHESVLIRPALNRSQSHNIHVMINQMTLLLTGWNERSMLTVTAACLTWTYVRTWTSGRAGSQQNEVSCFDNSGVDARRHNGSRLQKTFICVTWPTQTHTILHTLNKQPWHTLHTHIWRLHIHSRRVSGISSSLEPVCLGPIGLLCHTPQKTCKILTPNLSLLRAAHSSAEQHRCAMSCSYLLLNIIIITVQLFILTYSNNLLIHFK